MIDSRPLSIVFKLLTALSGMIGIILQFASGSEWSMLFSYYTIQSNIIVTLFFFALVFRDYASARTESRDYSLAKGAVTMCIMLTFFVYNIMLAPNMGDIKLGPGNTLVHVVVPLMVFADYLMFDLKGTYHFKDIMFWCFIPLLYPIYVAIYSAFGGRFLGLGGSEPSKYPYFFMDVDKLGAMRVLLWMLLLVICFVGVSMLYVLFDRVLGRLTRKRDAMLTDNE